MKKRRIFCPAFKEKVVELSYRYNNVAKLAAIFDLDTSHIYKWRKIATGEYYIPPAIRKLQKQIKQKELENEILKAAFGIPKNDKNRLFEFIQTNKILYSVKLMCRLLGFCENTYYRRFKPRKLSKWELENVHYKELIKEIFEENKMAYGYKRITAELNRRGYGITKNRVDRLMKVLGLRCRRKKKFKVTTNSKHSYRYSPNLVQRWAQAEKLNDIWVSDITYFKVGRSWQYLTIIIDVKNREVIGWSLSHTLYTNHTIIPAWRMALVSRAYQRPKIFHTDRGVQYASDIFRRVLRNCPTLQQSMSAKGASWENAIAESFFKTLKYEINGNQGFRDKAALKIAVTEFVGWYNAVRLHAALGYVAPGAVAA